jgi:mannose-1-phosphate guanylyltransferase
MNAMILSAGYGTRLRPLTEHVPKPLIPVGGLTLLEFHVRTLASAGIREIVINTHHLHRALKRLADNLSIRGVRVRILHEKTILGTGGGIKNAEPYLSGGPFVVVNADIIHGFDLKAAIRAHEASESLATMVLMKTGVPAYQRVSVDRTGRIASIGVPQEGDEGPRHLFTGIHVIDPEIFSIMPEQKFCCINSDIYALALRQGSRISAHMSEGYWRDLGRGAHYFQACRDFLDGKLPPVFYRALRGRLYRKSAKRPYAVSPPAYVSGQSRVSFGARIGPHVALSGSCSVAPGADVSESVLLEGARVRRGEKVSREIRHRNFSMSVDS